MRKLIKMIDKRSKDFIIGLELFVIVILFLLLMFKAPDVRTLAQTQNNDQVANEAKICLSLPVEDRASCAKIAGAKIKELYSSTTERYRECLKFRPLYIRDCQEGLVEAQ